MAGWMALRVPEKGPRVRKDARPVFRILRPRASTARAAGAPRSPGSPDATSGGDPEVGTRAAGIQPIPAPSRRPGLPRACASVRRAGGFVRRGARPGALHTAPLRRVGGRTPSGASSRRGDVLAVGRPGGASPSDTHTKDWRM